jgi:hypothetical protein
VHQFSLAVVEADVAILLELQEMVVRVVVVAAVPTI